MKHITLRLAMILGALVLVFLAIGRYFDSRCEGSSCIEQTFNNSVAGNGGAFNFHFGDEDSEDRALDDIVGDLENLEAEGEFGS